MIYLDNAATSFHKPDCVPRAVVEAMQHAGNSGRGSSGEAMADKRMANLRFIDFPPLNS